MKECPKCKSNKIKLQTELKNVFICEKCKSKFIKTESRVKEKVKKHRVYLNGELVKTTKVELDKEKSFKIAKRAANLIKNFEYTTSSDTDFIDHKFTIFESTKS